MARLAEVYSDLFATVFAFRSATDGTRPDYDAFRSDVMSLLTDARHRVEEEGLDRRGYAQYAAVALVDETVMSSDWEGAEEWRQEPLQVHYYGDFLAGEQFFDRLDEVRGAGEEDLVEVYFLALCAGFRGVFRDDPASLSNRRHRAFQQLRTTDLREQKQLTEEAYGRQLQRSLARSRLPVWWLVPPVLIVIGLWVAYYVILGQQVDTILDLGHRA